MAAEVCCYRHGPDERHSHGPRAATGLQHPKLHRQHPRCTQGGPRAIAVWTFHSPHTTPASPVAGAPLGQRGQQDGLLLPFGKAGGLQGRHEASIKGR